MSFSLSKLVAISFFKTPETALLLQQFEALYVYGVLSQFARFSEIQYKDLATIPDKFSLHQDPATQDSLQSLKQLCDARRSHFVFCGSLALGNQGEDEVTVNFRLYDSRKHDFIVNERICITLPGNHKNEDVGLPQIGMGRLNQLINQTVLSLSQAIPLLSAYTDLETMPIFSHSLPALVLILRAHQTLSVSEKVMLYEAAIREDESLETAYYHLARIYKSEHQYEKSVIYYRETLKVSQASVRNKASFSTEAGIACALLGRYDLALQWWLKAVEYDPGYIIPLFNIANTYEDQGNYEGAERYFLRAQTLAPDDYRTFFNLARLYSKMGVWEKALGQYQYQLQSESEDPWCHSDVATCYLHLGEPQQAKAYLEKTVALDPTGEAGQYAQLILMGMD